MAYDYRREHERYAFPDAERGGFRINRGTARPAVSGADPEEFEAVRVGHNRLATRTTLPERGPVIELDRPSTGIYVSSRRGVYLDLYQGVAQRLFDDDRIRPKLQPLIDSGLLLRREINSDDYLGFAPAGVHLPVDLADLVVKAVQHEIPRRLGYRVFFSNSGTEAVEAALKAATLVRFRRIEKEYGASVWTDVCRELGVGEHSYFTHSKEVVWRDYPVFIVALEGAFHGRTIGSLSMTLSRPVQKVGFPSWKWVRHVSARGEPDLASVVDETPLLELLATPGRLRAVVEGGRIPSALLAGAIFEPFQGEGGYRHPDPGLLRDLRTMCTRHGALLIADEVQTFARTGATFRSPGCGAPPDILCLAKSSIVGLTIIPSDHTENLVSGWHANTFGSGRLFDLNYAYAVWDTFLNERDPVYGGISYSENEAVKGERLAEGLDRLSRRFPELVFEVDGSGCMWGFSTRNRDEFVRTAWQVGAKLLGAGAATSPGRIRLILPADVLAKEIDDVLDVLESVCNRLQPGAG
ncbi:MAG TPA: aminotransferase class III-fold pyridoxal phosphate-dependent enzyme [Tepidiformaceae bacterium]|nr:aminotransferase class III-fold pyridoxal phosphate-dependent enzyme [Tepidiformaceae bacterium]